MTYPIATLPYLGNAFFVTVLSGLGLKTKEFKNAFKQVKFNAFVQIFNFFVDSSIVFGISRALYKLGALNIALADGMTITSCLPLTISMVTALTVSSNGDEAAAVFNAAFGNMVGIFLTPLIILMYLGASGSVSLGSVFLKLTLRVVLPICVGQVLQKFCPPVVVFVKKHKPRFKTLQELLLVYIVYCTFCKTFYNGTDATLPEVLTMVAVMLCILPLLMVLAWFSLGFLFPDQPKLRAMGLYGCTHKTVAMGIPLIYAIYEDSPLVGLYTLPVLIWHPMQLFIGTFVAPRLADYVDREEARLGTSAGEDFVENSN
jgi:sodium/bile acid cotransporter 7